MKNAISCRRLAWTAWTAWAACAVALCATGAGCSRAFWRTQSDREVYGLTQEKLFDPRWDLPRTVITPDPRSRMFDPYDPDKGPLPPDDPAAHLFMHEVAGMTGSKSWHKMGRALSIENPQWLEPFGLVPVVDDVPADGPGGAPREPGAVPHLVPPPPQPEIDGGFAADDAGGNAGWRPAARTAAGSGAQRATDADRRAEIVQAGLEWPVPLDPFSPENLHDYGDGAGYDETFRPRYRALRPGIEDLTLDQALELSYIHNREYQSRLEDVYLTALDVSFERFQFRVRYLGIAGEPSGSLFHRILPRRPDELVTTGRFGVSQLLPAGTQWLVELSNQTLWLFAGDNRTSTASALSYAIVQPLLQGAGRKIVLENLTQSERNLLYVVRDLSQFRREFFTDVTGGFLGLLLQQQVIRNQEDNIRRLEQQTNVLMALAETPDELIEPLEALPPELRVPPLLGTYVPYFGPVIVVPPPGLEFPPEVIDVIRYEPADRLLFLRSRATEEQEAIVLGLSDDPAWQAAVRTLFQRLRTDVLATDVLQLQTTLLVARNQLRNRQQAYQDALDAFKVGLGLPPDFQVTVDESLLDPLQLLDTRLTELEDRIRAFVTRPEWVEIDIELPDVELLEVVRVGLEELIDDVARDGLRLVERDLGRAEAKLSERLREAPEPEAARLRAALERDRFLFEEVGRALDLLRAELQDLGVLLQDELTDDQIRGAFFRLMATRETLERTIPGLTGLQTGLRVDLVELNPFEVSMEEAVEIGLANRVDLMNARAQVTDARRRVELAANQLQAVVNVVAEGELRTRPIRSRPFNTNPLDFRGRESEFRAGLRFTAPLDQIVERNNYRAALIAYQRARRAYMSFEDEVKLQIRASHRALTTLAQNFEVERQSMRISALQFDNAVLAAQDPAVAERGPGTTGLNLLNALDRLLGAQNSFIGSWVDYERSRLLIHQNMGIMEVDARGVWNDPFYQSAPPPEEPPDGQQDFPVITAAAETVGAGDRVRAPLGVCRPVVPRSPRPPEREAGGGPEPGDRSGAARAVPHLGDGTGDGGQPQERRPDQPR